MDALRRKSNCEYSLSNYIHVKRTVLLREEIPLKNILPCDKNGTLSYFPQGNAMIHTTAESYYTAL
jgi:hypothetical protein